MTTRTESGVSYALMAVPRMIARIGSPSLSAVDNLFTKSALTPSARPYPSALTSNVWQVDVGDKTPPFIVPRCCSGEVIRFAPATIAASHSPP